MNSPSSISSSPASPQDSEIKVCLTNINPIIETEEDKRLYREIHDAVFIKRKNILLSGPGGVGKSFILRKLIEDGDRQGIYIHKTAPTGIAALNIKGRTFHSYSGIKKGEGTKEKLYQMIMDNFKAKYRIKYTQILIVDEVSMFGKTLFDKINWAFQQVRENNKPFGNIQVIFTGDFLQLPPVKDEWVFESDAWEDFDLKIFNLTEPKRYPDRDYFDFLLRIRKGEKIPSDIKLLYERVNAYQEWKERTNIDELEVKPTIIYSKNVNVAEYNRAELAKIKHPIKAYIAKDSFKIQSNSKKNNHDDTDIKEENYKFLLDETISSILEFKQGAQVMLKANLDVEAGLVNGSRAVVLECRDDSVVVKFLSGQVLELTAYGWKFETDTVVMSRTQIPLVLAWSQTIHKSQGATLDFAVVDIGKDIFLGGQAYVALSRVKTKEGLFISCLHPNKIFADTKALKYSKYIEEVDANRRLQSYKGKVKVIYEEEEEEEIYEGEYYDY